MAFGYICLSDFGFAHIVPPTPPPPPPSETEGCWGKLPAKKLSLKLEILRNSIRNEFRLNPERDIGPYTGLFEEGNTEHKLWSELDKFQGSYG